MDCSISLLIGSFIQNMDWYERRSLRETNSLCMIFRVKELACLWYLRVSTAARDTYIVELKDLACFVMVCSTRSPLVVNAAKRGAVDDKSDGHVVVAGPGWESSESSNLVVGGSGSPIVALRKYRAEQHAW